MNIIFVPSRIIVALLLLIPIYAISQVTKFEVFPLKKNLHYSYDYYYKIYWRESHSTSVGEIDSGTVDYIVKDSIRTNDSTAMWSLLEIKDIWHWQQYHDTSYFIHDTSNLELTESVNGMHSLKASGLIWNFPLTNPLQEIFRYDFTNQLSIIHNWSSGIYPYASNGTDSIKLSDSLGLYYFHSTYAFGDISNGDDAFSLARLHSSPITSVNHIQSIPLEFEIKQNYPNPFNPSTTIDFSIFKMTYITVIVFDILGRQVATIADGFYSPGKHKIIFNASNLASGIYFYEFKLKGILQTRKMIFQK